MIARRLLLVSLVAICAANVGCAPFAYTQIPQAGEVNVQVAWTDTPELDCHQRGVGGCEVGHGDGACIVRVPKPRSFEDHDRLELLGHEVAHCLGGKHAWR